MDYRPKDLSGTPPDPDWKPAKPQPYTAGTILENYDGKRLTWRYVLNPDGSATNITGASSYVFSSSLNRYQALDTGKPQLGYIADDYNPPIHTAPVNGMGVYFDGYNYIPFGYNGSPPVDVLELRANWQYIWTGQIWQLRKKTT